MKPRNVQHLFLLRGLEALNLCLEHDLSHKDLPDALTFSTDEYKQLWDGYIDRVGLISLQALPIKFLQLAISDVARQQPSTYPTMHFLTEELKAKFAKELSEKILDPRGIELQKVLEVEAQTCRWEVVLRLRLSAQECQLQRAENSVKRNKHTYRTSDLEADYYQAAADESIKKLRKNGNKAHTSRYAGKMYTRARKAHDTALKAASLVLVENRKVEIAESKVIATTAKYLKAEKAAGAAKAARVAYEADNSNRLLESV